MMPGWLRLIHPAPALAVTAIAAAMAVILAGRAGAAGGAAVALIVASVGASQVATGALNDYADRGRDARLRPDKPISAGSISPGAALSIGLGALLLQLATSAPLGTLTLALGIGASASAQAYNFLLSRTLLSVLPYVVSFGLLPLWIAAGVGVPLERVLGASVLVAPFVAAAHLANTVRDFDGDAAAGSRSLAQLLGRHRAMLLALGLALAVGVGVGWALWLTGRLTLVSGLLGTLGLAAVGQGAVGQPASRPRRLWYGILVAAVCWAVAWALATG